MFSRGKRFDQLNWRIYNIDLFIKYRFGLKVIKR